MHYKVSGFSIWIVSYFVEMLYVCCLFDFITNFSHTIIYNQKIPLHVTIKLLFYFWFCFDFIHFFYCFKIVNILSYCALNKYFDLKQTIRQIIYKLHQIQTNFSQLIAWMHFILFEKVINQNQKKNVINFIPQNVYC